MIFTITFKDPDGVYEAKEEMLGFDKVTGSCTSGVEILLHKYIYCNEYIEIEFDTETKLARVIPLR